MKNKFNIIFLALFLACLFNACNKEDISSKEEENQEQEEMQVDCESLGEVFTIVEDMPEFSGGQQELFKFIGEQIQYPQAAIDNEVEGTVYVGFVVMEDGSIECTQVKRGLEGNDFGCNDEAIRVTEIMPNWIPGKQSNEPVKVAFTLPIQFKL